MLDFENTDQIKRTLMIIFAVIFLSVFIFTLIFQFPNLKESIAIYMLFILSTIMLIRGFYVDRFYRLIKQQEKVDFWVYWANGFIQMFTDQKSVNYLIIIIPFIKKKEDRLIDKVRIKINIWTYSFYFTTTGLIIYLIYLLK